VFVTVGLFELLDKGFNEPSAFVVGAFNNTVGAFYPADGRGEIS
jgi:hypothetical protein